MTLTSAPDLVTLAQLEVNEAPVARYVDGRDLPVTLAPRPFLHPVLTLAGTVVTDERPEDHAWHLGVGFAVQDVAGHNLWGGRTYVRDLGYTWKDDHGSMRHEGFQRLSPGGFVTELTWLGADGGALIHELREVQAHTVAPTEGAAGASDEPLRAWILTWYTTITVVRDADVALGSPATNGRDGGAYGGFFWRLPPMDDMTISTPGASGETAVHGSRAAWLGIAGTVRGPDSASHRPITLVAAGLDELTRHDAWFVRAEGYPGFGSSLAREAPLMLRHGHSARRAFGVVVADGAQSPGDLARRLVPFQEV